MKKYFVITILIIGLTAADSFAQMHQGMMGQGKTGSPDSETSGESGYPPYGMMGRRMMGYGMGPGMMGYGGYGMMDYGGCGMMGRRMMGYGMGPGMMGPGMMGYGMGPGMMGYGGCGMMGRGMMGYGMGQGMTGYGAKEYQAFLDDTVDLRRKLHNKKFEYFEASRNPDTKRETVTKLEKEIWELQREIYEKQQK